MKIRALILPAFLSAIISGCTPSARKNPDYSIASTTTTVLPKLARDVAARTSVKYGGKYTMGILLLGSSTENRVTEISFQVTAENIRQTVFFQPLSYIPTDPEQAHFLADAVTEFVEGIKYTYPRANVEVSGFFYGHSENQEKGNSKVYYNGEYGTVYGNGITVNGKKKNVIIYSGDRLSNGGIAFMRAYGISSYIEDMFKKLGGKVTFSSRRFFASETGERGAKMRNVEIYIRVTEKAVGA